MHSQRSYRFPWRALKHTETGLLSYSDEQLARLESRLAGSLQQPGYPGYNDDRMVFMHTEQHYPQLIVHATCDTDVVAALDFARARGLAVTCRSGGHSTAGYSVNDQLVIDTSRMDHVLIDRERRTARVGPGVNFRKFNLMLDAARLHVPGGGCETVCVAGYMMGGGYGFSSRLFGMNSDHVIGVRLAKPDGTIVHARKGHHEDLLWAIRGGTGNQFGVLLEIEYRLVELHEVTGFGLRFPLGRPEDNAVVSRVIACLQKKYSNGPESDTGTVGLQGLMMYLPTAKDPTGQHPCFLIRGLGAGSIAETKAALGPLLDFIEDEESQIEIMRRGSYLRMNEALLQTVDPPGLDMPTVSMNTKPLVDSRMISELHSAEEWLPVIEHFLTAPDRTCFIAMEFYGGAINEVAADATAYVHRDASLDFFSWAFWTFDSHEGPVTQWLDTLMAFGDRLGNGLRYQNYPRRGNPDFREQYFAGNLDRLMQVKRDYDPDNLFAYEQGLLGQEGR
ncbi:FAD-dependent oxidoreductase [Litorisediminicola beolgyonensis]|uniref:FAD-dependent oxidoreductase n=1 Tax=Litorisediminicola beolgyonensis TaxID=1173614 RepID=A0ABW3ZGC7_9RHOB